MGSDTRYFTHDHNARHDLKIQAMMKKYKVEGYGRFWILVEVMRESTGYKILYKDYVLESLATQMDCDIDELKSFIQDCIEKYDLFVQGDGFFYSESLLDRMGKLDAMREKKRNAAYAMHEKYKHNITQEPINDDI
jgi:hypothetical protein